MLIVVGFPPLSCRPPDAHSYGEEVENYLEVYLRTPGLEKKDIARALLARGNARKQAGERLLAKAQQDFQAVAKLDPSNRELQGYIRRSDMVSVCVQLVTSRREEGRRSAWPRVLDFDAKRVWGRKAGEG